MQSGSSSASVLARQLSGGDASGLRRDVLLHGAEFFILFFQMIADALDIGTEIQIVPKLDGIRRACILLPVDDERTDIPGAPAATGS